MGADQTCAASPHQCLEQADGAAGHCNRVVRVTVGTPHRCKRVFELVFADFPD